MNHIIFLIVILLANIVQGITGFAGTILAMPFALMLVGYEVGKPILNVLGLLSGIYVFAGNYKAVNWKELKKIVIIMCVGMISGIVVKSFFVGNDDILYKGLGVFVIGIALHGLLQKKKTEDSAITKPSKKWNILLVLAGVVHGIFVSGGPLLIGYLSKIIKDKVQFRATISTVWIFLNTLVLIDDIRMGLWNVELIKWQLIAIPFLFVGMKIGTILYDKMSQQLFMKITYILLFISGISLLV
ncbi:MAG: sulfite exporter TauE/SafE family protein [Eubacteriales bacterium]